MKLGQRALLMGVLNVTPDSFSDGGEFAAVEDAVAHGLAMAAAGADMIDVGGESTRPGAPPVSAREECRRIVPVIRELREALDLPISVDTTKAEVAAAALEQGASIVNDVSGMRADPGMHAVVRDAEAGMILMHSRGTPETMQTLTDYADPVEDIARELDEMVAQALERTGLPETHVMVDPGVGFAKTAEQNLLLIRATARFRQSGRPVLMGPSRKSFIGVAMGGARPADRVWGTAAAVTACVLHGADMVRVHDVPEMRDVLCIANALRTCTFE
ncbi:MAG: dihydropteroate synthase [Lentisphaeria bacterium]|nr:dihydropteroate synthase [Lentisphaeria bacterium]